MLDVLINCDKNYYNLRQVFISLVYFCCVIIGV